MQFRDFLGELLEHLERARPVEADPGGALLQLQGPEQRRQTEGHAVQRADRRARVAGRFALARFQVLPVDRLGRGVGDLFVAEDMGMAAHHLVDHAAGHVVEGEGAGFLGHAGVEHHLEQQVAQLVGERAHVVALDGLGHLVGFLDGVGRDGAEGLLHVPGATAVAVPESRHDPQQLFDGAGLGRCLVGRAHGAGEITKGGRSRKGRRLGFHHGDTESRRINQKGLFIGETNSVVLWCLCASVVQMRKGRQSLEGTTKTAETAGPLRPIGFAHNVYYGKYEMIPGSRLSKAFGGSPRGPPFRTRFMSAAKILKLPPSSPL